MGYRRDRLYEKVAIDGLGPGSTDLLGLVSAWATYNISLDKQPHSIFEDNLFMRYRSLSNTPLEHVHLLIS